MMKAHDLIDGLIDEAYRREFGKRGRYVDSDYEKRRFYRQSEREFERRRGALDGIKSKRALGFQGLGQNQPTQDLFRQVIPPILPNVTLKSIWKFLTSSPPKATKPQQLELGFKHKPDKPDKPDWTYRLFPPTEP